MTIDMRTSRPRNRDRSPSESADPSSAAYIVIAYIIMACLGMACTDYGLYIYGPQ